MPTRFVFFVSLCVFICQVPHGQAGCAEVDSMTEAVAGESFSLNCISCKKREEVPASAFVEWHFRPSGSEETVQIFHYKYPDHRVLHKDFIGRLEWHGTLGTRDVQIGAIVIHNVTHNDTGTYLCRFHRTLFLPLENEQVMIEKQVDLSVVDEANRELTAVISEIMMYVLIAVLQVWMILVLIYCYQKIFAENEAREARKAARAQKHLLDPKDSCDGVHLE